jgi:hypothetical protein
MLRRPSFLRRISARLSKELGGFQRTPRSSRPPVDSNSVTSGLAGFDPVLRAPLPQSRLLGLVREIVPPFAPVPDLPGPVRLNPLSYGVDGLRGTLNGGFGFGIATDFAVLGSLAAILLAIGAYLFSKIEV